MDLPAPLASCLAFMTRRGSRAWTTVAELESAGVQPEAVVMLDLDGLIAFWPEKDAWALTPLALFRLGVAVDDGRGNEAWAPMEVRERWELVDTTEPAWVEVKIVRDGKRSRRKETVKPARKSKAYDLTPFYAPASAPHPGDNPPGQRRQDAYIPIPAWAVSPHAGPVEEAIAREEAEFVMATRYAEDGSEITAPLEILGVKVRPLRRPRKGA